MNIELFEITKIWQNWFKLVLIHSLKLFEAFYGYRSRKAII